MVTIPLVFSFQKIAHHNAIRANLLHQPMHIDGQSVSIEAVQIIAGEPQTTLVLELAVDQVPDPRMRAQLRDLIQQRLGEPVTILLDLRLRL